MRRIKRGDTLIEVLIAVTIFSIAALSAVGIMNHGLNNTQAALETTMARTEIDAQAESLRFIHDSYASGKNVDAFKATWQKIINLSQDPDTADFTADITDCSKAYEQNPDNHDSLFTQNAFVLNSRKIEESASPDDVVIASATNPIFTETPVNPRILYGADSESFYDDLSIETISQVEGIWVVAVRDHHLEEGEDVATSVEYFDFYIHTCWNTPGNSTATNLSTTIRLHNPDAINSPSLNRRYNFAVHYEPNGSGVTNLPPDFSDTSYTESQITYTIPNVVPSRPGYIFRGWSTSAGGSAAYTYQPSTGTFSPGQINLTGSITLYAVWGENNEYCIKYLPNPPAGTVTNMPSVNCVTSSTETSVPISSTIPALTGYALQGWTLTNSPSAGDHVYTVGDSVEVRDTDTCGTSEYTRCVYAYWKIVNNADFTVLLNWGDTPRDLDSWVYGVKSDGSALWSTPLYYSSKSKTNSSGVEVAKLEYDFTSHGSDCVAYNGTSGSGNCPENVTIKASLMDRGNSYFYSVWAFTSGSYIQSGTSVDVIQRRDDGSVRNFHFDYPGGNHKCWNVFAIRSGNQVIQLNEVTDASSQETCATTTYNLSGRSAL